MRLGSRGMLLLALAVATWPVGRWYVMRTVDGSDEPWGILALATLTLLAWPDRSRQEEPGLVGPATWLATYAVAYLFTPPLVRAIPAACAFGALLFRGPGAAGRWGLLALSLPVVATLQFYLGYPLRALAAAASASTLRVAGFAVEREGTLLHWGGETVMVDVPCSGIHMLWFGLFIACLLATWHRLNAARTLLCVVVALFVVVAANVARATVLFFKEAHLVAWPEWTHAGVGLVLFAGAAWAIAASARHLQPRAHVCR